MMSEADEGLMITMHTIAQMIRKDEREKAARLVENWPVDCNYIVGKMRIEERRKQIAKAIRDQK